MRPRRVALVGARGVANYGGFETFVAELAPRLSDKGYEVFLSRRRTDNSGGNVSLKGARAVQFPFRFPRSNKAGRLFEILYDWYFVLRFAVVERCNAIYCLGIASGPILLLARLLGAEASINIDGLEWKRAKFGALEKAYIKLSFQAAYISADRLVLDNRMILDFLPPRAARKAVVITYGVSPRGCPPWNYGSVSPVRGDAEKPLAAGGYWLVVARLEPENNIHDMIEAYGRSAGTKPLVVVGSFSSRSYEDRVEGVTAALPRDKSVIWLGSIYDQDLLYMLRCHCFAYLHGHSVGGTNPSLLEAMSAGNLIIAHDNVFNREVCKNGALYFDGIEALVRRMSDLEHRGSDYLSLGSRALAIATAEHRWEDVADAYDRLFSSGAAPSSERQGSNS